MGLIDWTLRLAAGLAALALVHWAMRPEILPALAAAGGTAAAMGAWAGALLCAAAAPVALGPARGLGAALGAAMALRGAALAAPWVAGPALPMEDAGALVLPVAMAAGGLGLLLSAAGPRPRARLSPRGAAPRSRA